MEQKHYMDIKRLQPSFVDGFRAGDRVVIQEKIDGANFSIRYDAETDSIRSFSSKTELSLSNNLRGAWEFAQQLDTGAVKEVLGGNLILFGEWLVPHTVVYPKERYDCAYFYDVFDTGAKQYLDQDAVKAVVGTLGLTYVPVFYDGEFTSWADISEYVGKTELGGEYGEGIVVKNMTRLNSPDCRLPFYTKIVCETFCEVKKSKSRREIPPEEAADRAVAQELTESIVTDARVRKLVHKLVDDGVIPEDWCARDMGTIARNIGRNVYEDCVKEEPEVVESIGEKFGKYASSTAMNIVKGILKERERVDIA